MKNLHQKKWKNSKEIKGLIIREPWITYILKGLKIWEIRKRDTKVRGLIGLVYRKLLRGFAILKGTRKMYVERLKDYEELHRVSYDIIKKYAGKKKELYIWEIRDPIELKSPIKIKYPRGAQVWVKIPMEDIIKELPEELSKRLFQSGDIGGKEKSKSEQKTKKN